MAFITGEIVLRKIGPMTGAPFRTAIAASNLAIRIVVARRGDDAANVVGMMQSVGDHQRRAPGVAVQNRSFYSEPGDGATQQLHLRFRRPGHVLRPLAVAEARAVEGDHPMPAGESVDQTEVRILQHAGVAVQQYHRLPVPDCRHSASGRHPPR